MIKKLFLAASLFISISVHANCDRMFPAGKPLVKGNYTELCRKGYAVIYNNDKKIPFLTFELLTPETIGRGQSVRTGFKVDTEVLPRYRSSIKDYARTGNIYDRGHLANAQNAQDDEAMADTMLLSNIVPQVNSFNRGSWKTLESHLAKSVRRGAKLYVITGTIASGNTTIGNSVAVPEFLFKVIVEGDKITTYILPNEVNNRSYRDFRVPYSTLKGLINVELLPNKIAHVR